MNYDFADLEKRIVQLPRYTDTAFPPYRFIPGLNPHPHRDPNGHSYGHETEKSEILTSANWKNHSHYLFGVDLYNHGYWWESHEAWETAWQALNKDSQTAQYLQGLIQISASFIKWYSHLFEGCEKLFNLGFARLNEIEKSNEVFLGLNIRNHNRRLRSHFLWLTSKSKDFPDPFPNYPAIQLDFS